MKFAISLFLVFLIFTFGRFIIDAFEITNTSYVFLTGYIVGASCLFINLLITGGLKS